MHVPKDLAIAIDSRMATSGVMQRAEPRFLHISTKVYVLYSFQKVNAGALNGGNPLGIVPITFSNKNVHVFALMQYLLLMMLIAAPIDYIPVKVKGKLEFPGSVRL